MDSIPMLVRVRVRLFLLVFRTGQFTLFLKSGLKTFVVIASVGIATIGILSWNHVSYTIQSTYIRNIHFFLLAK